MYYDEREYQKERLSALKRKFGLESPMDQGVPRITPFTLKEICTQMKLFQSLELNDKMYLHRQGFRKIENLDQLTGLRALWLEGNAISEIENLEPCKLLRCLFVNRIILLYISCLMKFIDDIDICKRIKLKKLKD